MALIICPKCGKAFSENASACPNCGISINESLLLIEQQKEEQRLAKEQEAAKRRQIRIKRTKYVLLGITIAIVVGIGIFEIYKLSKATLVIPEGVETIYHNQYNGKYVKKVIIPNSVTSIEDGAFDGWESLTGVVWNAKKCTDFSSTLIYSPFKSISTQITSFVFGEDVEYIPAYLCYEMSKLTAITIPNSVTSIGKWAFYGCDSLATIIVREGNTVYDSRNNCNAIINTVANTLIAGCRNTIIPNSVTSIGDYAFRECSSLTSITIPNSVTSIGDDAFLNCSSLTSVTIGNGVTSIGNWAFYGCTSLTSITIPNGVTSIGNDAFRYCSSLTSVTIPNSVTSIGYGAFDGCSNLPVINNVRYADTYLVEAVNKNLSTYNIKSGTRWIGDHAFSGCSSLTSVTIGNSVTSIGGSAFYKCSNLTSITIPNSVTSIGDYAFSGCSSLTAVHISDITSWCAIDFGMPYANPLYYAKNLYLNGELVTDLIIPESVKTIKKYAFEHYSSLKSVTISNGVTSIGKEAFSCCYSLTSITIPNSVTSIGKGAFEDCNLPVIDNVRYADTYLVKAVDKKLSTYNIKSGTRWIGSYAFKNCKNLTSITIPNSVTSIEGDAFSGCSSLTSITIPNSVTSIGKGAFEDCSSLTTIIVEKGNIIYDSRNNCNAIIETTTNTLIAGCRNTIIPNSVTSIEDGAFDGCEGLTSVTIPNSVTSIGEAAFRGCSSLTSVTIGNSVTSIGDYAFYKCSSLTSITIPNSVTSIGEEAFLHCSGLKTIYNYAEIPQNIWAEDSDYSVFYGVDKSKCTLYVPANSIELYQKAKVWKDFIIKPISD